MKIVADQACLGLQEAIGNQAELILLPAGEINNAALVDADALICRSTVKINESLIQNTQLKFIGSCVSGTDHVDFDVIQKHNIQFADAKGCNAEAVKNYVCCLLAHLGLIGQPQKIAVIGAGEIGSRLVTALKNFGHEIIISDPFVENVKHVPLNQIQDVDVISLHVPLTRSGPYPTYHMIDQAFLKRQKDNCVLINSARADVTVESDLIDYAKSHKVCLDVWHREPEINPEMLELAHYATPHIAGHSVNGKLLGTEMIYRKLVDLFGFKPNSFQYHTQASYLLPENMRYLISETALLALKNQSFSEYRAQFPSRHQ